MSDKERQFSFQFPRHIFEVFLDRPIAPDVWLRALDTIDRWWESGDLTIHRCVAQEIDKAIDTVLAKEEDIGEP